jgi:hypothetical protein
MAREKALSKEEINRLAAFYGGNTAKYVRWALQTCERSIVDKAFPYLSKRPSGRNFSDGDILSWYLAVSSELDEKIPIAMNGGTGVGKSRAVLYFAHKRETPLIMTTATPSTTVDDLLCSPQQDPDTGRWFKNPGPLAQACIYQGIFFLDEVDTMDPDGFIGFNDIVQGMPRPIEATQYGQANLEWKYVQFIVSGNFHMNNPDFNAASRNRFVCLEFERPEDVDTRGNIMINARARRKGTKMRQKFDPDEVPREFDAKPVLQTSLEFENTMNRFLLELDSTLYDFARLNRGLATNGRTPKGIVGRLFNRGGEHYSVPSGVYMKDAKRCLMGRPWGGAEPMSMANADHAGLLFHPEMTKADYTRVLHDVYVHPAFLVMPDQLDETAAAYKAGMGRIIDQKLNTHFERLKEKMR